MGERGVKRDRRIDSDLPQPTALAPISVRLLGEKAEARSSADPCVFATIAMGSVSSRPRSTIQSSTLPLELVEANIKGAGLETQSAVS